MNDENRGNRLSTASIAALDEEQEESIQTREVRPKEQEDFLTEDIAPLLDGAQVEAFRSRWIDIQTRFVDDPGDSVQDADELVAQVIKSIAEIFAEERTYLEEQWKLGDEVSTEDLRLSMTRYRSFFNRLLAMGK